MSRGRCCRSEHGSADAHRCGTSGEADVDHLTSTGSEELHPYSRSNEPGDRVGHGIGDEAWTSGTLITQACSTCAVIAEPNPVGVTGTPTEGGDGKPQRGAFPDDVERIDTDLFQTTRSRTLDDHISAEQQSPQTGDPLS